MAAKSAGAGGNTATKAAEQLPLNFGKRLAHTDKVVRDKGFRTLKVWLKGHTELERLDFLKLWKGLHFGMWMADKRPVQQELAVNIALLLNDIPKEKQGMWIETFWETLEEAWERLDTHRMSKYMLFARIVVAEYFKALREQGWKLELLQVAARTFTRNTAAAGISGPNVHSLGLMLHYIRLFWEELKPQLSEKPKASPEAIMVLLEPFVGLAEGSYSDALVKTINEQMLREPPAEYKDALLQRVLAAVDKSGLPKKNRQALRASATALGAPAPEAVEEDDRPVRKRKAFGSFQPKENKEKKKKKAKKADSATADRGSNESSGPMSPLMLPQAAVPIEGLQKKKLKKGRKTSIKKGTAAAGAREAPLEKKKKKVARAGGVKKKAGAVKKKAKTPKASS